MSRFSPPLLVTPGRIGEHASVQDTFATNGKVAPRGLHIPHFIRLDSVYNLTRHMTGLAAERSPGLMDILDLEGTVANYLMWRRSEARVFVPSSPNLDVFVQARDLQMTRHSDTPTKKVVEGYDEPRLHAVNSTDLQAWEERIELGTAGKGVDLFVSVDPAIDVGNVVRLIKSCLADGGDMAVSGHLVSSDELVAMFGRVERCGPFLVGIGKVNGGRPGKAKRGKAGKSASTPASMTSIVCREWIKDASEAIDPLSVWIRCRV